MSAARDDAAHLPALLGEECAGDAEVEQLGVTDDGVERRAQLVAHHGEEIGLGLVRRLGMGACRLLALQLQRLLLCFLPIGDVAQADQRRWLVIPRRLHHAELGDDGRAVATHDLDLRRLPGGEGKAELLADELRRRAPEQTLGGGIGKSDQPFAADDDDPVGEPLDDLANGALR